ncbi:MAG: 50S ribosomal protein L25 [Patescibacteria group bacterium]
MATKQQKIELNASKREIVGSGLNALRKSGYMPAILYGKGQESIPLQIPVKDFRKAFELAGESTLIFLNVNGQAYPTIIHDIARDAVSEDILHADFYKVRLDEKIKAKVEVVFQGESPAVRDSGAIFVRNINELEIEAFPQDLPHEIVVDISSLKNMGEQILVKNLKLDAKLKVIAEAEEIIATVQEPMSEAELEKALETPTTTVEDVEVIKKEKEEEIPEEEVQAVEGGPRQGREVSKESPEKKENKQNNPKNDK